MNFYQENKIYVSFPFPSFPSTIKKGIERSDRLKGNEKKKNSDFAINLSFYSLDIGGYGENKLDLGKDSGDFPSSEKFFEIVQR